MCHKFAYSNEQNDDFNFACRYAEQLGANDPGGIASTAFLSAFNGFDPEKGTFRALMMHCLKFDYLDQIRSRKLWNERHVAIETLDAEFGFESETTLSEEEVAILYRALDRLKQGDRTLIALRFLEGKSYEEISQHELPLSPATLRQRLRRALQVLRAVPELRQEFQNN